MCGNQYQSTLKNERLCLNSRKNAILTSNLFGFCLQISVQENYEFSGETLFLRYCYKKWALIEFIFTNSTTSKNVCAKNVKFSGETVSLRYTKKEMGFN